MNAAHPGRHRAGAGLRHLLGTVVDWHGSIVREMAALHPAWTATLRPRLARSATSPANGAGAFRRAGLDVSSTTCTG